MIEGAQHVDSVENSPTTYPKVTSGSALTALYVRAMYDYEPDKSTELKLRQGDTIQVIAQLASGWWDGKTNGVRGWFPANYCETVAGPEDSTARDTRLRPSSGTNVSGESSTGEEYKRKGWRSGSLSARERSAVDSRENKEQDAEKDPVSPRVDKGLSDPQLYCPQADQTGSAGLPESSVKPRKGVYTCEGCGGVCHLASLCCFVAMLSVTQDSTLTTRPLLDPRRRQRFQAL